MKIDQKYYLLFVLGFFMFFLLLGCVPTATSDQLEATRETREIASQTTIQSTRTPSPTKIWPATAEVLEKPVSTKTITPTSVPTLSVEQRKTMVSNNLLEDTSCNLPCWWGIMPGTTTWQEAEEQFHRSLNLSNHDPLSLIIISD
jgi:hypothetical protein